MYRLSRLYDRLGDRSALVMLAAWRGSTLAVTRAKYQPSLHDSERQRARAGAASRGPACSPAQPCGADRHGRIVGALTLISSRTVADSREANSVLAGRSDCPLRPQ